MIGIRGIATLKWQTIIEDEIKVRSKDGERFVHRHITNSSFSQMRLHVNVDCTYIFLKTSMQNIDLSASISALILRTSMKNPDVIPP